MKKTIFVELIKQIDLLGISNKNISRKRFFKWAGVAALIPLAKVWHGMVESKEAISDGEGEISISRTLPDGVHFFDGVILIKDGLNIQLFSSKCTHLGCRIDKIENDELVCPCHGSRYNLKGEPIVGPSVQALRQINFQTKENNGKATLSYSI